MTSRVARGDDTTNLGFEQAFEYLRDRGQDGPPDYLFGFESRSPATPEGVRVWMKPDDGEAWSAMFAGEGHEPAVCATPDPGVALVVIGWRGYFVETRGAELVREKGHWPVTNVVAYPEADALVLIGSWDLFVYRSGGRYVEARDDKRMASEGVRVHGIEGSVLRGEGYWPRQNAWHPFELDLDTGRVEGGPG